MQSVNGVNFQRYKVSAGEVLTIAENFCMVVTCGAFVVRGLVVVRGSLQVKK